MTMIPVFDGHNDLLTRLYRGGKDAIKNCLSGEASGQLDLPRMKKGGFAGGLFALWVPSHDDVDFDAEMAKSAYDIPLSAPVDVTSAQKIVLQQTALFHRLAQESKGEIKTCTSARAISETIKLGKIAAALHMEGAEALDPDFYMLDVLYAAGLRSIGPVWSRPNDYGHGVPFRFPASPDTGDGLTEKGKALVQHCTKRRIMLDVSHINQKGFEDMARLSSQPIVATHCNAWRITPHARNLTDVQLDMIAASKGLVGLNFASAFLDEHGRRRPDVPLSAMLKHLDHLLKKCGENGVGLGSDFDGAMIPSAIGDVAGLPHLFEAMRKHGYGDGLIQKIASENWINILKRIWQE